MDQDRGERCPPEGLDDEKKGASCAMQGAAAEKTCHPYCFLMK